MLFSRRHPSSRADPLNRRSELRDEVETRMLWAMVTTIHSFMFLVLILAAMGTIAVLLGQRVAIADLEARLEGLTEQVGFDDLTGVYRRTAGERRARLSLRTMPCIVGFIDVRDFGMVNKTLGWDEGDRQLVELTRELARVFGREHDTIYRFGGDEFVIVLPVVARATEALLGDERVETDIVTAAYDRTVQVLTDLAEGAVKFDWALEMSSRPPIEPGGALLAAMEEVRRIKSQRAFFKAAHQTIEKEPHV